MQENKSLLCKIDIPTAELWLIQWLTHSNYKYRSFQKACLQNEPLQLLIIWTDSSARLLFKWPEYFIALLVQGSSSEENH